MFTDEQKEMLSEKLDATHVKGRQQAGRNVSYIEGWHAIAEANRIFGFDGWSRETIHTSCVWEGPYTTDAGKEMHSASYIAKVRVTVGSVIREGTGSGGGIAVNPGEAHESAVKEAETDAMKRALITFGNPFGLALYDKTLSEVEGTITGGPRRAPPPPRPQSVQTGRPLHEAHNEITNGTASTVPQGKPANAPQSAKEWANGAAGHQWIQGVAMVELKAIGNAKAVGEWKEANAGSLDALEEHCPKRHRWLKNEIDVHLDYLTNLRAAG